MLSKIADSAVTLSKLSSEARSGITGLQGPAGSIGDPGPGIDYPAGTVLSLVRGTVPPAGFELAGTTIQVIKPAGRGRPKDHIIEIDVYIKR
jgi:hypothetical protein